MLVFSCSRRLSSIHLSFSILKTPIFPKENGQSSHTSRCSFFAHTDAHHEALPLIVLIFTIGLCFVLCIRPFPLRGKGLHEGFPNIVLGFPFCQRKSCRMIVRDRDAHVLARSRTHAIEDLHSANHRLVMNLRWQKEKSPWGFTNHDNLTRDAFALRSQTCKHTFACMMHADGRAHRSALVMCDRTRAHRSVCPRCECTARCNHRRASTWAR